MIENYRDDIVVSSPAKIYRRIVNFHTFWQMKSLTVHFCASCGGGGRAFEDHGRTWPSEERPRKSLPLAFSPRKTRDDASSVITNNIKRGVAAARLLIIIYTRIH